MKKAIIIAAVLPFLLSACVSKKKFNALSDNFKKTQDELSLTKNQLNDCNRNKESSKGIYDKEIESLKGQNYMLLNNIGNLSTLSKQESANLEKSLESLREKDVQIKTLNEALNKKDSVTIALVTSLKGAVGPMDDKDIEINVDKGVVFISISDKLLFKSGSYEVSGRAREVLSKVAKVINNKPDMDVMVEGHTDNIPYFNGNLKDNWDLSTKRSTTIVRILQNDFKVDPKRLTAAGRSSYNPLTGNDNEVGRSVNRRTRILILPKLDQFYGMIEEGMKEAEKASPKK